MDYPKILILGQTFDKSTGTGVTMSNLFKGWPKDKIAVACHENLQNNLETSVCDIYYQLGYKNKLHPFPFGMLLPKIKCGIQKINKSVKPVIDLQERNKYKKIHSILQYFLNVLGIKNYFYHLKYTKEFQEWVEKYNPDIIYSQLSTIEIIRFVDEVKTKSKKSLAIHIMDDWLMDIGKESIFYKFSRKGINNEIVSIFNKSSTLLSICQAMTDEYKRRYNLTFHPFHNPIEIDRWLPFSKKSWETKKTFYILYSGRVGRGIKQSIIDIARAVESLYKSKIDIKFQIQTIDFEELSMADLNNKCIEILQPIKYEDLPKKFASADLLVLPLDFDKESIDFLKYSIQTKVAEYMISGTPILVYADKQTALATYAKKEKWAYSINNNNKELLVSGIYNLMTNQSLRENISRQALDVVQKNHNSKIVTEHFRKTLVRSINSN